MEDQAITAEDVLAFWFPDGDTPDRERHIDLWIWRMRGGAHDAVIARFSNLTERAAAGDLDHWAETARGRLALIVVLDQFSRSVWAGTPRAFAQDRKALALCLAGLDNGDFDALPNAWFKSVYKLPLEHCECPEQANLDRAVAIAAQIARNAPESLRQDYERGAEMPTLHRDVIAAFGRHPHRNAVLGRTSTEAEIAYLDNGDFPHQKDLRAHLKRDRENVGRGHMAGHGYEGGRLNLPFTGIATFARKPHVADWTAIAADAAILGAPFDAGTQYRAGARFGPRSVREASTLFSFGHAGAYDHEDDATYLGEEVRIVDLGDADIIHTDTVQSHANIESGVRAILAAGALPVVIGGDHSVNIPCIDAFSDHAPFHMLQIDAHLDFVDERHGVRNGHGNPMRRAAEKPWVSGLTQVGIRNVSSTAREGYEAARAMGSDILSVRQMRALGVAGVLARLPRGVPVYITLDIDAFCPSIAPGTGTPSHGGFLYYEVLELLQGVARGHDVVGVDLVEVAPDYDPSGSTPILAAQILMNLLGFVFHARAGRA